MSVHYPSAAYSAENMGRVYTSLLIVVCSIYVFYYFYFMLSVAGDRGVCVYIAVISHHMGL